MTCSEKWFNKESDWFLKVMIITVNLCLLFVLSADRDYGGAGKKKCGISNADAERPVP